MVVKPRPINVENSLISVLWPFAFMLGVDQLARVAAEVAYGLPCVDRSDGIEQVDQRPMPKTRRAKLV